VVSCEALVGDVCDASSFCSLPQVDARAGEEGRLFDRLLGRLEGRAELRTFDNVEDKQLGTCESIEEIMIGEDNVIKFNGVPKGEACTIVLRGASSHLLDEMERSLHDALCVLTQTVRESRVVFGGGASEMAMAYAVMQEAQKYPSKEQLAMFAFANALQTIPTILADNAGFDSAEIITQLRALHAQGKTTMGVDMDKGVPGDMSQLGVCEAFKSKSQSLVSAHEAAEMILRVDDIVKCAPRQRSGH